MAMSKILISYRREDSGHATGRLYDHLSRHFGSGSVFMDVDSIAPGTNFRETLENAVCQCECLIAVIGRRWFTAIDDGSGRRRIDQEDDWVRIEIEIALEKGIKILPLLLDQMSMPKETELPESLSPLACRQAIQLRQHRRRTYAPRAISNPCGFSRAKLRPSRTSRPSHRTVHSSRCASIAY